MSAKIVYDPTDSGEPSEVTVFGQTFKAGKAVEVSDDLAIRLMGNPFFVRKDKPKDDAPVVEEEQPSQLRSPKQAQLAQGDKPDTGGPARPVAPEKDPAPGAGNETRF